jgi:hypothetical protein
MAEQGEEIITTRRDPIAPKGAATTSHGLSGGHEPASIAGEFEPATLRFARARHAPGADEPGSARRLAEHLRSVSEALSAAAGSLQVHHEDRLARLSARAGRRLARLSRRLEREPPSILLSRLVATARRHPALARSGAALGDLVSALANGPRAPGPKHEHEAGERQRTAKPRAGECELDEDLGVGPSAREEPCGAR